MYTAYIVKTNSRKFIYVDDIGIVKQEKAFKEIENTLGDGSCRNSKILKVWYLILNVSKLAAIAFQ